MDYKLYQNSSKEEKVDYFLEHLSPSNRVASYYVNWDKVNENRKIFQGEIEELGFLLGKDDVKNKAKQLFLKNPESLKAIPILIAHRLKSKEELVIMELDKDYNRSFYTLDFENIDINKIDEYMRFIDESGLFDFFENSGVKNLADYLYGVEVGMDTNARKNRSGTAMESFIERHVRVACESLGYKYKTQMTSARIKKDLKWNIKSDRERRKFDAVIYNDENTALYIIETNYYGGAGTKPSSVSGEFTNLDNEIKKSNGNVKFIWVTDGLGWEKGRNALIESFKHIDYIFNMEMLEDNFIYEFLNEK